ncbi:MAG TPA: beta-N-acetylhexosaminidase [Dysgonomonas sp.]|nr:beta-N-acetylhexosaminidase [Dysgonomonas sp.]
MKILNVFCVLFLSVLFASNLKADEVNPKPFVIPELKEWKSGKGTFQLNESGKIIYPEGNKQLQKVANLFADDYYTMFGKRLQVATGKSSAGDFVFSISKDKKLGKEGYSINISDKVVVSAPEAIGVFWATRTLLQISEQSGQLQLPCGQITDYPDYELRGFMLDCGRKFIPISFLRDYVKMMAYYKMNAFQIHLNDNGFPQFFENNWDKTYAAFRLESETYPELTAQDGFYTKKEFIELQKLAEENFVEIIPEIDIPAHSLAFSHYKPEIGSKEYGMDHLDLFNPETYNFLDNLLKEYLGGDEPVFRGKRMHVGTDEYSNKKQEVVEKFRYFTDYYIRYVESFGKQACIWGALTHARGGTPVKSDNVLMWAWHNNYAQPDTMIQQGYKLVSIPDGLLYIVPAAGYYYDYLNTKKLYNEWTPARIGKKVFAEKDPNIAGGMFAVWNDHVGNGISTKDIHHRVLPALHTLAVKMWTGNGVTLEYDIFDAKRKLLSEAPGVNIAGKIGNTPSLVYSQPILAANTQTGHTEIGYDYTVRFEIEGVEENKGTVLLSSPNAVFYLSDPIKGLLGFSRDGYLYTFNYRVKKGSKAEIKICGDNKAIRLYIDDRLKEDLKMRKIWFNEGKASINYVITLVFPLEKTGDFKSRISAFEVYNYCDE